MDTMPGGADKHLFLRVDVRSPGNVDVWIKSMVDMFKRLDGAVNMAGVLTPAKPIVDMTDEDWDLSFAINAKGVFNCLRA